MNIKKIGILTAGGDCPGLNAVVRAVSKNALRQGVEVIGFKNGFDGVVRNEFIKITPDVVSGILTLGGNTEAMGSHKGYGFSMICELLTAITSFGATSNHHVRRENQGAGSCHAFIVINPEIFGDTQEMKKNLNII